MNAFLQETIREIAGRDKDQARKLLWSVLLALAACLFGLAGLGFLTTSIYIALNIALGAGVAALLIGVGFTSFAGALFFLAFKKTSKQALTNTPKVSTEASNSNGLSLIAFTAAYVLARQFPKPDRD
ncbi:hypothetical protein CLV80_101409 [Yoonia maritima]|uniref:Uncharacterized protein n=1 Tax=Yoonia maritima TaxID=1435347 RepID=A0A2T0W4Z4_9RHOB|nr:hypothetical protein CLV80_101409 [Yoonia maritima]